ncbi:MAG TPA: dihydroneopterin aldolase [Acidimicrobiia bacterium]|nr:dihydroneopterin aldolase [Acidimicrobiia bacterium]
MTDRIDLRGIEVYARHGVLESEQERAQVFKADVTVFTDLTAAGDSDDLSETIDYSELALEIREVVGSESHKLIETVAARVADAVMSHPRVESAIVTIHKPDAPIDLVFDDVAVTIERRR